MAVTIFNHEGVILARLHETTVAEIDTERGLAKFRTGGWQTKSTCDAIRRAMREAGLAGLCYRQRGVVVIELEGHEAATITGEETARFRFHRQLEAVGGER